MITRGVSIITGPRMANAWTQVSQVAHQAIIAVLSSASADAVAAAFGILVRFIKPALRTLLVVGLVVAVGALFTGPPAAAVRTRSAISSGIGRLRRAENPPGCPPARSAPTADHEPGRVCRVIRFGGWQIIGDGLR